MINVCLEAVWIFDWRNFKAFCIDKMKFLKKIKDNAYADV